MLSFDNIYTRSTVLILGSGWLYSMNHYMIHCDSDTNLFNKWSNLQKNILLVSAGGALSGAYCYLFVNDKYTNRSICE